MESSSVLIFPNPTNGNLTIKTTDFKGTKKFTIFNTMGQVVLTGDIKNATTNLNVDYLSCGMYFIELSDGNKKLSAKFIKN